MWWVSISSPLNSGSPHSGQNQCWFSAILKSLEPFSKRDLPNFRWRFSPYSFNQGSSGLASPLTFIWRSMRLYAIWYRTSSLSFPSRSLVLQANTHLLPLIVLKKRLRTHEVFWLGCLRFAQRQRYCHTRYEI